MRRRIAALVAIAVVVVIIVAALVMVSRDGSGESDPQAGQDSAETAAEASATTSAAGEDEDEAADAGEKKDKDKDEDDPASRGRCDDKSLKVEVRPSAANFDAGSQVLLYAEITNTSDTTCDRDLAGAPLTFEVYRLDDNTRVWSSTDCTKLENEDKVDLAPKKPVLRQIEWSGRISQPGACEQRDRLPAEPGAYQVYALVGEVFSPAATFNLVRPGE